MEMKNRNEIITAIEVAKSSGVPMLFISNPGYGKTTVINAWAEKNGYHVESVIGSAFDRSEILGYQVNNGKDHLDIMKPYWFHNIEENEKNGVPSVLFIDEISTAPGDVQGSLFRLIFERTIGNGMKLPESTVIMSAANYKDNLPAYFEITSPALNRFCIINLGFKSLKDVANEFLSDEEDLTKNWPTFQRKELDAATRQEIKGKVRDFMANVADNYVEKGDFSKGFLDVRTKELNNIYEAGLEPSGEVLNFISGRTVSYLNRCVTACVALGLNGKHSFVGKMIDGLIGLGTNTFQSEGELKIFRASIKRDIGNIIDVMTGRKYDVNKDNLFEGADTIAAKVQRLSENIEGFTNATDVSVHFMTIYKQIQSDYPVTSDGMTKVLSKLDGDAVKVANFKADLDAIQVLSEVFKGTSFEKISAPFSSYLFKVVKSYDFYKTTAL